MLCIFKTKKTIGFCIAAVLVAALVVLSAIPYPVTQRNCKNAKNFTQAAEGLDTSRAPFIQGGPWEQSIITASVFGEPSLPYLLRSSEQVVRAKVVKIEYAKDGGVIYNPETKYVYEVADRPEDLERVTHILLVLQVQQNLAGSLGWRRHVRVYLPREQWESFYSHGLQPGQSAVFFLAKDRKRSAYEFLENDPRLKQRYQLNCGEHGVFLVQTDGTVRPLSNLVCNRAYSGQKLSILQKDIKKYKKEMCLR